MTNTHDVLLAYQEQAAPKVGGHWIWDTAPFPVEEMVTCLLRRTFTAEELAADGRLFISADGRYRAYLNGELVSRGPCRGTPEHYFYETVDLAGRLRAGLNVLAVEVRYYGRHQPVAEVHREPGLWAMIGPRRDGEWILTDGRWKVLRPGAQSGNPIAPGDVWGGYVVVDPCEDVDLGKLPAGWTEAGFDDSAWAPAVKGRPAIKRYSTGMVNEYYRELVPRQIPPLEDTPVLPVAVMQRGRIAPQTPPEQARRIDGALTTTAEPTAAFWGAAGVPLRLEGAGTDYVIVNMGELTTAYPRLVLDAPSGTMVELRYCEALSRDRKKAVRDDPAGTVEGYFDLFTCRAGENTVETFVWRTFRFLRIAVHHPAGAVTLRSLETVFTGYPYQMRASFESSDPLHRSLWDVSWRTARLCAHEHYEDCPYYEQLQYTGDTRLQGLVAYLVAGDYRLARQALRQYAWSRRADGILLSRTPSNEWKPQIIPTFSLIWVEFLEDYYRHSGDAELVRELFPTVEGVLAWFDQFERDGVLQRTPYWIFTDWSLPVSDWTSTSDDIRMAGSTGELNLRRVGGLKAASRLARALERGGAAKDLDRRAKLAIAGVRKHLWSKADGLFRDDVDGAVFAEHASIQAILQDLVTPRQGRAIIRRLERRKDLCRTTIYYSYYTFRAYQKLGLYEQAYRNRLSNWTDPLKLHASTWFEQPEPSRSDCHAWGSWIMCDLLTSVLGVSPEEPGFARVRIAPNVMDLQWAKGTVPTPRGPVSVSWKRDGGQVRCEITLPAGVSGTLVAPDGQEQPLDGGMQEKTFAAPPAK